MGVLVCGHAVREDDGGAVGQKHLELLRVEGDDNLDEREVGGGGQSGLDVTVL